MAPDVIGIEVAWTLWVISWLIAARFADRPAKRLGLLRSLLPYLFEFFGFALLLGLYIGPHAPIAQLWALPQSAGWALVCIAALGFGFAWWARIALGRLWSGFITKKADHHIIDTGPYGIVRHPIYTGLLLAVFATVAIKGTALTLAGGVLLLSGWFVKAKIEEGFLSRELGVDAYDAYRKRVPMLIPFMGG